MASTPNNDPLHLEALLPNPGQESRPIAQELTIYPGFFAISQLSNETHRVLSAVDTSISKKVTEAAYAYYAAAISYARMLKVLSLSSRRVTAEEEAFMTQVYNGNYHPPEALNYYLKGIGNTKLQNQRELRFRARPRPSVASRDGSIGWFGKIGPENHFLYASYPCLPVYLKRIQADFNYTDDPQNEDPYWDLPDDIAPDDEDAGHPTPNLLGWAPAMKMSREQIAWLQAAGFGPNFEFTSEHDTIPLIVTLLDAVQQEIDYARIKTGELSKVSDGSLAQTVVINVPSAPERPRHEGRSNMIAKHALDMNGSIVMAAKALRYLQEHHLTDEGLNTWSIYEWNDYADVPEAWRLTANNLFDGSSPLLKTYCYRTVPAAPATEVRKLVEILLPNE